MPQTVEASECYMSIPREVVAHLVGICKNKSRVPEKITECRESIFSKDPEETRTDLLTPPRSWPTAVYDYEYNPLRSVLRRKP